MPPTSNKRKRSKSLEADSDTKAASNQKDRIRSKDVYFEDGNIILIADDVAFRVHKGQIRRHSEVFRDMLEMGDQPADAETFDGCPVVRVSDSAEDIRVLLSALYDCTQLAAEDISTIATVSRMSTKYLMEPLRTSALQALRKVYPDTLAEWDRYQAGYVNSADRGLTQDVLCLVSADILFPAAHYNLCDAYLSDILDYDPAIPQHVLKQHLKGREIIATKLADFFEAHIRDRTECPKGTEKCRIAWEILETLANGLLQDHNHINAPNPLFGLQGLQAQSCISGFCKICRPVLPAAIKAEREDIWTSLPKIFGLGSCEKLRKIV